MIELIQMVFNDKRKSSDASISMIIEENIFRFLFSKAAYLIDKNKDRLLRQKWTVKANKSL